MQNKRSIKQSGVSRKRRTVTSLAATITALSIGTLISVPATAASAPPPFTVAFGSGPNSSLNPFLVWNLHSTTEQAVFGIYEPLLNWDSATGQSVPCLATSYSWSNGGRALTLQLRQGVKWSDGQPFTSADVVFTFDLMKQYPALSNINGLPPLTSIKADGQNAVTMTFSQIQYNNLFNVTETFIVPQHIWVNIKDPTKYANPNPVGTGPYLQKTFTIAADTLVANPNYWGGQPKVPEVVIVGLNGNTAQETALETGAVQWTSATIPAVQKVWVAKDPAHNFAGANQVGVISLVPNLTVYPLNLVDVRQAISMAINRNLISSEGESGNSPPVENQAAVLLPVDKAYLDPAYASPYQYNVTQAKALLKAAGLKMGSDGYFESSNGQPISLTLEEDSSFTDYMADAGIIAQELSTIGLKVTVSGVSDTAFYDDFPLGHFQLTVLYSESVPNPMYDYQGWLDYSLSAPMGKSASEDYGRYHSAQADQLLNAASSSNPTSTVFKNALFGLEKIVATQLPVIPMVYNQWHGAYTDKYYTGWPTASNPYAAVSALYSNFELILLHLRPAS